MVFPKSASIGNVGKVPAGGKFFLRLKIAIIATDTTESRLLASSGGEGTPRWDLLERIPVMNTAVPSSANSASGPRAPSRGAPDALELRRAPVLLRLAALPASSASELPSPTPTTQEASNPPAPLAVDENDSHEHAPPAPPNGEPAPRERASRERGAQRHERRETQKRQPATLSQWILGGCMLAAGVTGFFVLSGDWGGSAPDAPPTDGWSRRADEKPVDAPGFNQPQFADAPPITVHRESTTMPQSERHWSNPAEGEIAPAVAQQQTPTPPNWMGGDSLAPNLPGASSAAPTIPSATYPTTPHGGAVTAGHTNIQPTTNIHLAPPGNAAPPLSGPPRASATSTAPMPNYPNTGAAEFNALSPTAPVAQTGYPSTGYASEAPSGGDAGYAPAARVGMREMGTAPAYPPVNTPSSGYPTTGGVSLGSSPNDTTPPAMSPRYERIR